jgi:MSHA pilin protein MshD
MSVHEPGIRRPARQGTTRPPAIAGLSLVELIAFIVIVGVAVAGVLSVMSYTTLRSADPMVQQQAQLIAESYLDEILLKPFVDPNAGTTQVCPAPEATRATYDNICDYNGLNDDGARDQLGSAVAGLEEYNVAVTVSGDSGVSIGPAADPVDNSTAVRVLRVEVTVTHQNSPGFNLTLAGYRTHYACAAGGDTDCLPL